MGTTFSGGLIKIWCPTVHLWQQDGLTENKCLYSLRNMSPSAKAVVTTMEPDGTEE